MKTEKEIRQAIKDSEIYFKKTHPRQQKGVLIRMSDMKKGIEALAVANEICTLKWVIGKGKLNCER